PANFFSECLPCCGAVSRLTLGKTQADTPDVLSSSVIRIDPIFGTEIGGGMLQYSFFKTLPVGLTIYNVGSIGSIAVIAYLGGNRRITSPRAVFMIHRSTIKSTGHLPLTVMKGIVRSLTLDDERIECILKDQIVLPVGQEWSHLDDYDF